LVRNAQNVGTLIDDDARSRSHAGLEQVFLVGNADHDVIRDDVLHGLRGLTELQYFAGEGAIWIGLDDEGRLVSLAQAPDIAFADIGIDFHLREVGGDQEKRRRLEARRHRLADRDVSGYDGPVDGRDDVGIAEVHQRRFEYRFVLLDDGLVNLDLSERLVISALGAVDRVLRDDASLHQPSVALIGNPVVGEIRLVLEQLRFGICAVGRVLIDDCLVRTRIDFGTKLADANPGIEITILISNDTRHIAADGDGQHRVHRTSRGHRARDDAARNRGGDVTYGHLPMLKPVDDTCAQ